MASNSPSRILSGINPSGRGLHIGNYFGMVKPSIALQNNPDYETYYFIADLHALTTVQNPEQLTQNIYQVVLDYLALGLDPAKCVFFRQSQVPAHCQLAIVLANYVGYGQMQRMHAFKDKLQKDTQVESINMGLFNYPILMAADILVYRPDGVPVGEDQRQHVELARDIAERFNKTYGREIFRLPSPLISQTMGKIVGTDGQRKMSKSLKNIIGIFDEPAVVRRQIMNCFTDPQRQKVTDPGRVIGNPVFVYHDLINENQAEVIDLKSRYQAGKVGDVEVKEKLISAHQRYFGAARQQRALLATDPSRVETILAQGARQATVSAEQTLAEVYQIIGLT